MDRRMFAVGLPLSTALQLSGCATRASINDGLTVKPSEGLLAFKITSTINAKLKYVKYEPGRSFSGFLGEMLLPPSNSFVVERGVTYYVHPVEAGEYMWGELAMGMGAVANLHGSNRFVVKSGVITYVGHLSLGRYDRRNTIFSTDRGVTFSSLDQEQDMIAHLKANFPKYMATMPFQKAITEIRIGT